MSAEPDGPYDDGDDGDVGWGDAPEEVDPDDLGRHRRERPPHHEA